MAKEIQKLTDIVVHKLHLQGARFQDLWRHCQFFINHKKATRLCPLA